MFTQSRLLVAALFLTLVAFAGAADPLPVVKPVVPGGGSVRVRIPLGPPKAELTQFKAHIPKPKGKKGETIDITVGVSIQPGNPGVSLQQWKAWGFDVPDNRMGVLPELIIPGAQLAPKPTKGRDVEFRITNLKLSIQEVAGGDTAGLTNTIGLSLRELTGGADRAFEPRVYFADRFLELTAPGAAVKKLNAGDMTSPDPQLTADDKLAPGFIPFTTAAYPLVVFVSVNGQTQYISAKGDTLPVIGGMASSGMAPPGIIMSVNMARGCGVELNKEMGPTTGKVRELRFGLMTGSGFKAQKDLVLKDVTVWISNDESSSFIWLGPAFADTYFKDGVYGCASDGVWRLHGRVKPELIEDVKTRKPVQPKKP